jgi:outer membrane protein assembly factor BamD (BamD/ComL family)
MMLRRASALEERGELEQAITCLQEFITKAQNSDDVESARQRMEAIRLRLASSESQQPKRST